MIIATQFVTAFSKTFHYIRYDHETQEIEKISISNTKSFIE